MLIKYLEAAMRHARYEILLDDDKYYGEIPECNGVYATAGNLEDCREEWILFRVHRNLPLPEIEGIKLVIKEVA